MATAQINQQSKKRTKQNPMPRNKIIQGNALTQLKLLPSESVNCCITSPPYWGLRKYAGEQEQVWGGRKGCEHEWSSAGGGLVHENRNFAPGTNEEAHGRRGTVHIRKHDGVSSQVCVDCGAWKGALGLEPRPESYIQHLVEIFREVRRVLRSDGVCFLNIADTYFNNSGGRGDRCTEGEWKRRGNSDSFSKAGKHETIKQKDLCLIPERLADALQKPWRKCLTCNQEFHESKWAKIIDRQGVVEYLCPNCLETTATEVTEQGWYVRDRIAWVKRNPMPASVKDRRSPSWEYVLMLTKSDKYWFDREAVREPALNGSGGRNAPNVITTSTEPFQYEMCRKCERIYSTKEYRTLKEVKVKRKIRKKLKKAYSGFNNPNSNVGERARSEKPHYVRKCVCGSVGDFISHFATFPRKLVEPLVLSGCPATVCQTCRKPRTRIVVGRSKDAFNVRLRDAKAGRLKEKSGYNITESAIASAAKTVYDEKSYGGEGKRTTRWTNCKHRDYKPGNVLDPFAGTATVGVVALRLRRAFIGIEISREYCKLARHRLTNETKDRSPHVSQRIVGRRKSGQQIMRATDASATPKSVL